MKREYILEGVLFAMGNAVDKDILAETMGVSREELEELAKSLSEEYQSSGRGFRLLTLENKLQLSTAEGCYETLIRLVKKPSQPVLTEVVLETLSIIAYKQPVTKADIERIRGVSSDHAVNKLVEYGLVEEAGRLNAPGRPILFRTSEEFLRRFNISSVDELPEMDPVQYEEIVASVESEIAAAEAKESLAQAESIKVEI
ncbi:MAG: SMC-Scp complex subunit ScpB [Lachnospiraceae bacterium]|nr:SMC-Scp complex subunit ScpB [Lachnospiraceae bacterium]